MIWQPGTSIWTPPRLGQIDIPLSPPAERRNRIRREIERDTRPRRNPFLCPGAWQEWEQQVMPAAAINHRRSLGAGASTLADAGFYYKFETTGWLDSTAGGNNLTGTNTPTVNTGKIGNAVYLVAASSQYLDHADATQYDMSTGLVGGFTITAWVYTNSLGAVRRAVWKGVNTTGGSEWGVFMNASSVLAFLVRGNPTSNAATATWSGTMSSATWYFVESYYTISDDKARINVDNGTPVASGTLTSAINHTANHFAIGTSDGTQQYWDGRIDSVGGFKRLLTAAERTSLAGGTDPF